MPVIRSLVCWYGRSGRKRTVRLYKSWRNLNDRAPQGAASCSRRWRAGQGQQECAL
jgi:hypothetical protein